MTASHASLARDAAPPDPAALHGSGEVLRFRRLGALGGAELLHGRFGRFTFARHAHDRPVLSLITRGALTVARPGGDEQATAGSMIVMNQDQLHWGGRRDAEGWTIRTIYFDQDWLNAQARAQGARFRGAFAFRTGMLRHRRLLARVERLHRALWEAEPPLAGETQLQELLHDLLQARGDCPPPAVSGGREPAAVARARDYLAARLDRNVTLEELARAAGLSPFRLARAFGASQGQPPHAFHLHLRLQRALALLRAGEPVAEVAATCGFADQSHLTRAFKRAFGITPGLFRRG